MSKSQSNTNDFAAVEDEFEDAYDVDDMSDDENVEDEEDDDVEDNNVEDEDVVNDLEDEENEPEDLDDEDLEDADVDEDDANDDNYLQKFNEDINTNFIANFHPEIKLPNYNEIRHLIKVVRDNNNIIVDPFHKTEPILTKYEKTRILGQRAKQINTGSLPFVKVPKEINDGYIIAEMELKERKIPFIIARPLPNGTSEYWNINDLEIL
jgi:DNA-directed RNA polymerase subunit K/omega